jgi:hypothetical protein
MECGSAKQLIKLLRGRVNDDCDTPRYDDAFYLERINLAMLNLYAVRPDEFPKKTIEVDLKEGSEQFLPSDVTMFEFLGTGYKDASGKVAPCNTKKPEEANSELLAIYSGRCSTASSTSGAAPANQGCDSYSVSGFSYEPKNGGYFTVSPPAPAGTTAKARFLVSACPQCTPANIDETLPCKLWPMLYEKSAALMLNQESEDAATAQKAAAHEQNYTNQLGLKYQTDSRLGSGYFRGQTPDGAPDPNVRRG